VNETIALQDAETRDRVVEALRDGLLVVLPTDSVYALVADAFSRSATTRLTGAKRRSRATPPPVLIRSPRQTTGLVEDIPEHAERLMASYWPGPLTLVFQMAEGLNWDLGDSAGTVSLRVPTDDFLLSVIREVGPLAATSANRAGQPLPTTAAEARERLGLSAALYVDGGERDGPRSTIVDVTGERAQVLAEGAVPTADVEAVATGQVAWGARP
jgi:L-threonylcarbamoyladenylate synthase